MAYLGVASWFCCGSAYGPCQAAGGGACGGCQSSQYHVAWPKVSTTNCNLSGCGMSLPWKACGNQITVTNQCTGDLIFVTIKDCGPHQSSFCNTPVGCGSCGSYCEALVDLTPRAFTRLANLDLGRIPVSVGT